jgi:uncharacterized protein YbjQ (UPF0145 family)
MNASLKDGLANFPVGRVKAAGPWRSADECADEADRRSLMMALVRETGRQGADMLIDVRFEADETVEIDGVSLRRLVATGSAVGAALAA